MNRDEIGLGDGLLRGLVQLDAQLVGAVGAAVRIAPDEPHAERPRAFGDQAADAPEPEDGKRLASNSGAREESAALYSPRPSRRSPGDAAGG